MFPGGISDKLGNRYEAKWLVRQLLDVISSKSEWLRFEGITQEFTGFEFAVFRDGLTEWHQTKTSAPNGNWTIRALERENVLGAFKNRLGASNTDRCLFVSQDPAKDLHTLVDKVRIANDFREFTEALSQDQKIKFDQLTKAWSDEHTTTYAWLKRCEFLTLPEAELDTIITSHGDLYFAHNGSPVFALLRDYVENRFNKVLTTEIVRSEIRNSGTLTIKDWSLDQTLRERLCSETDAYLQTYSPFGAGGSTIPRHQTDILAAQVERPDGPIISLLTGVAGSGKSGVIRGIIGKLRGAGVKHLAFRVDHHLDCGTPQKIGRELTGREESPVSTLKGLEPERLSVLIIDQVDAVSEVSGRSGTVKEALFRMINDARNFETVRLILVCRSFDLDSDPRLKTLKEAKRVEQIDVPLLEWDSEVAPLLADKGVDTNLLSPTQKDLLRLPLHLAIFLEIGSDGQSFASRNDLFKGLIQRKDRAIRQGHNVAWTIASPLTALAQWMSDRQKLDAPETVLDDFPCALDLLASEGLIVQSRNRVNFFHESFFDYLYARAFIGGAQSLVNMLTSTEQHLFRRTQTRQILEALRYGDSGRYYRELVAILTAKGVRYHIKAAVMQWLGSLSDPSEEERDIVLQFDDQNKPFRPLVRHALISSAGWFFRLHKDGWILIVLNGKSDERRQTILWWLSNIAGECPVEVAELLEAWWGNDPERGKCLLNWFGFVRRQKPDHALLALCEKVIRSRPPGLFEDNGQNSREMLLATWAEKNSDRGVGILQAIFDTWFDTHPDQHPFKDDELRDHDMYTLAKIAEKSPKAFITGTIKAFNRSIDEITRREASGERDSSFKYRPFSGHRFGADEFLGIFRSALQKLAREDPNAVRGFLSNLDASKHEALLHLHLEVVSVNGEAFAHNLIDLLGNKNLFKAGWSGADWKSFADAARSAFPFLLTDEHLSVEKVIFSHQPEIELAIKVAHQIKEQGETEPWWNRHGVIRCDLNQSGFQQWCILETIGEDLLTDAGVQHLIMLRRKFPNLKVPIPDHIEMHKVGSPIKRDKIKYMNDDHWLSAIAQYDNDDWRRYGPDDIDGGARQLAGELQHAVKENPERFVALLMRIPHIAHHAYVCNILWGLAETEGVNDDLLKKAIIDAHTRPEKPYGEDIARIFERHPQIAKDTSIFKILEWYVENGTANEDETVESTNAEREIVTIDDLMRHGTKLHVRGMNGARGYAAEAMRTVIWKVPEIVERAWDILGKRIENEPLISVRCCLIKSLVPLYNNDRLRCAQLVEQLIEMPSQRAGSSEQGKSYISLSPLVTHEGTYLLIYLLHGVPNVGRQLIDRLLNSGDETMRQIGAWHVFRCSFRDQAYSPDADRLIEEGDMYRRLAADVVSHAITQEEFRERAELQLIRFFNDEDKQVRQRASTVFREIESHEFGMFYHLAHKYIASRSFEDGSHAFFDALEQATSSVHELVICAAEKLLAQLEINDSADYRPTLDLHHLNSLLKREYAASENDPDLRRRLLDVIDRMLERELHGTDEILKAHERE